MDFLIKERPAKLQCQYLWAVKEKVKKADDDPFRVNVSATPTDNTILGLELRRYAQMSMGTGLNYARKKVELNCVE